MADKSVYQRATDGTNLAVKYHDNGDGTFTQTVDLTASGTGQAVTVADGADVTQGAKADAAIVDPTLSASGVALLKGLLTELVDIDAQLIALRANQLPAALGQAASNSSFPVVLTTDQVPLPITQSCSFSHLAANATTTVKASAGTLHSLTVNTKGIGNTVTIKDNATVIAVIDTTITTTAFLYDVAFATSLVVVIAGGTAADITVAYR